MRGCSDGHASLAQYVSLATDRNKLWIEVVANQTAARKFELALGETLGNT